MLKTKIQKDHYVHIVTSNPWIMYEKMEKFILIVCPSTSTLILTLSNPRYLKKLTIRGGGALKTPYDL